MPNSIYLSQIRLIK